ncbi:MAG: hypothetical protein WC728_04700 [Elusimicrobiota bacterium]
MRTVFVLMFLFVVGGRALAQSGAAPAAQPSTPPKPAKIEDLFNAKKVKSPFLSLTGSGGVAVSDEEKAFDPNSEETDKAALIKGMSLKGILKDKASSYALLHHAESRTGYYFRSGRLYDYQGHAIRGVKGRVNPIQMTVILEASGEKAILRMGEDKEEEDEEKEGSSSPGGSGGKT